MGRADRKMVQRTRTVVVTAVTIALIVLVLALAQLIPAARTNPPSRGDLAAPPPIAATLRRACYDCHSNETRWPWYSRIAPFSWIIAQHVAAARMQVNFSEWDSYYPRTRRRKLEWIGRALANEKMPPWYYRVMHPGARLTAADRAALLHWIESTLTAPSNGGASDSGKGE